MFNKFPSTPYIETDKFTFRNDKVLDAGEIQELLSEEITVEEKIDGANLGISFDNDGNLLLQNRGSYLLFPLEGQWKPLEKWINQKENQIFDVISDKYILFGEWCYIKHSIYYDALPDWFIAFDIYDKKKKQFLSVEYRNQLIERMDLSKVPILGYGKYSIEKLKSFFGQSKFGQEMCEGIYLRQDKDSFLRYRAKIVRHDFNQGIEEHWSKKTLVKNRVVWDYTH